MKKRVLSLLLTALLIVSLLPTTVLAEGNGNLEFNITQDDHIGTDGKTIEYENGYKLSVDYEGIGDNVISTDNGHTELRNIPDGTEVTFTLTIPEGQSKVPDLMLSSARETFVNNTFTTNLNFSQNNVIRVELDFGGNPGPGPEPAPEIQDGDVLFRIGNGQDGVVEYSFNNTNWTSAANNSVLNASDLSGVTTIYIKATPNEGRQLDDYIDDQDHISVNRVTVDGTPSALEFTDNVASFTYNSTAKTEVSVRFMGGGQDNPPAPEIQNGDVLFRIGNGQDGVVEYSFNNTDWTPVTDNSVLKASDLSDVETIYIKATPNEGQRLDDYIDNGISVNRVTVDGTPSALEFTDNVASFTYNSSAKTEVAVRFMGGGYQDEGHIVKIQIANNNGSNGSVQCKFNTEENFRTFTEANKDDSGNIKLEIPENAATITFKVVPDEEHVFRDYSIFHDDQRIETTTEFRNAIQVDGYEYTLPDDDKTIVFRADFGNEADWHTVSWDGGNVKVENGQVKAYAVHVGENTYDESVETADETNKRYPLSAITDLDISENPVSFLDTDLFISDTNEEDVSIDFRFIPDYGYQVTDVRATEDSLLSQFAPGTEISTFNFTYIPKTNVHFIVQFTKTADIINRNSSIVTGAAIENGGDATNSGNLKMDIADVAPENVSEGLKNAVGETDAQYLDMTLSQVVSKTGDKGDWENPLTELNGSIDVSLTVSDLDPEGEYVIIREHTNEDGSVVYDEIPVDYDHETSTISFATDKFSTYALVKSTTVPPAPASYTVTFDMGGYGTEIAKQTVDNGNKVTKPADPTADGYTFDGWYADATFSVKFDFDSAVTKDTTIYAKWTKNAVTPTDPQPAETIGDANGDGAVNMKDVLTIRKVLADLDVATYNALNADVNADGDVNMKDVLMLRKYLAGLIETLGA